MKAASANKVDIPAIGFGTSELDVGLIKESVINAIRSGYRMIDTAAVYGSEDGIGLAVRELCANKEVDRRVLFIQTKLAGDKHGYHSALQSFEESLNRLQLDYIDMYLIHWPVPRHYENFYREKNIESWQAFEELLKKKKVRAIGVCNFLERHLLDLMENCEVLPMVNQLEIHPQFQQRGLVRWCREHGLLIEAWAPLGRGGLMQMPEFIQLAQQYGKSVPQLCLRWSIQKGNIPLPRSSNPSRIAENISVFDFTISEEDMDKLDAVNTDYCHMDIWSYRRQIMY